MNGHDIGFYQDGYKKVEFCKMCGKEGYDLLMKCEKIVDKKKEPGVGFDHC